MDAQCPIVSVIMPCYNDGRYLEEAVSSLKQQTYQNIELIIIDDGSDDAQTIQILGQIDFPSLQIIRTNHVYPAAARNMGVARARGVYILPLDADDKIEPAYIQKAVEVLESQPEVGVVYCHADLFGEATGPWELPPFEASRMLIDNIVFVTSLIRKSIFDEVGGFDESLVHGIEDYDFFLSVLEKGWKFFQLPDTLFHYRVKANSRSAQFSGKEDVFFETYRTLYRKHHALYQEYMDELFPALHEEYLRRRQFETLQTENKLLRRLVHEKGIKGLLRLLYYRYRKPQ